MKKALYLLFVVLLILSPGLLMADNIRGNVVKNVILSDSTKSDDYVFTMGIEDLFAISIDRDSSLIKGFEIEIKVPSSIRSYSGSLSFEIFKQIGTAISTGTGTYFGDKYQTVFLPEASKFYIQIPYGEHLEKNVSPYTEVLDNIVTYKDTPLMIAVEPMMKGIPSSLYNSDFTVQVYPLYKENGKLKLNISIPEDLDANNLKVSIDGKSIKMDGTSTEKTLSSGRHSVSAEIEGGLSSNKTFTITPASTSEVELTLDNLESFITLDAPENTTIYIDSNKVEFQPNKAMKIPPGDHTVLFMIGDYKISKNFTVSPGKDCKISLFLDILVEEN
ncbi:MAG: hypothetical protein PQJ46_10060 [Spirochaetales bacterium]|nr:hypothetical protein [Spirochaetales bacterium]